MLKKRDPSPGPSRQTRHRPAGHPRPKDHPRVSQNVAPQEKPLGAKLPSTTTSAGADGAWGSTSAEGSAAISSSSSNALAAGTTATESAWATSVCPPVGAGAAASRSTAERREAITCQGVSGVSVGVVELRRHAAARVDLDATGKGYRGAHLPCVAL